MMPRSAADILRTYTLAALQQLARQRGLETKKKNKEALVIAVGATLFRPEEIQRGLTDLSQRERTVLDRVILAGGDVSSTMLKSQLQQEGIVEPPEKPKNSFYSYGYGPLKGTIRARDSTKFEDIVARLSVNGLLFTEESVGPSGNLVEFTLPGRRLFIPPDILRHLPPVALPIKTGSPPAEIVEADAAPLLRDLYLLLSFAARESIPLTARGLINKRTLGRLSEGMRRAEDVAAIRSEDELTWLPLLRAFAEQLGLLAPSVGELVLDPRGAEFLRRPAGERRQRLYEGYRQTRHWNELFRIPDLKIRGKGYSQRVAPAGVATGRQRVLDELAKFPPGEWIDIDHLIARIRIQAYEFLLPRRGVSRYYYSSFYDYSYGASIDLYQRDNPLGLSFETVAGTDAEYWQQVEAQFIRLMVTEPLAALGIVDLGRAGGQTTAFRITPDGRHLLRGEPLPATTNPPQVVIQPNFQIFAFEPTGEDVLFTLDQIADRVHSEQAVEYELTRDSIYRAESAGMDIDQILTFLESVSTVDIPQNVRRTLEEWGGQLERITIRQRAPLLHVADAALLDQLYANPKMAPLLGRRLAPTAALVASANLESLRQQLIASGQLPALTEGPEDPSATGPHLSVNADGEIAFHRHLPSIFDLSLLRPFTEDKHGVLRLTPGSLRRAARAGQSADTILTTLKQLGGEPANADVAAFVRRWAKDWGRGALFQTAILQVDNPNTRADLLADPALKPYLQAIPDAPTLALVRPEGIDKVRALLDERGMSLEDRLLR